ncbi:MAG: 2Fe-2S iron-sulfur cluster-binding protein [Pseudobdellovibrio sp.]
MKIKFMPQNIECDVDPSKSLLQIAKANGIKIKSICNGVPSCAECRVRILEGDNSIPEPSKAELNLIGTSYFLDGRRLSCQVHCFGDVTVDLTEQINKVDTQKKVRGFKQKDQKEISAVQDTMILNPIIPSTESPTHKQAPVHKQAPKKVHVPSRPQQNPSQQNKPNPNQNPTSQQNRKPQPVKKQES